MKKGFKNRDLLVIAIIWLAIIAIVFLLIVKIRLLIHYLII